MAIGVIWYPAIDQQAYEAISDRVMQPGAEKGMRFHAAGEADGQWRIFEVWDSRDGQAPTPQPEVVFDIRFQSPEGAPTSPRSRGAVGVGGGESLAVSLDAPTAP